MNTVVDVPHPQPEPAGAAAGERVTTVLCVDDEPNILSALRRTLRADGLRVLTAAGGAEALQLLEAEAVDLVVSDMRMPGMDGAALLEHVHARWPASVRLLLTGHADTDAAVAAINRGRIFRYLHKPWDEGEFRTAVRQGLQLQALERERERLQALTTRQNDALREANERLERRVQERTAELTQAHEALKRSYLTGIKVFSGLIEMRGGRLAGHGRRVAEQARKLAQAMTRPDDEVQQVFVAALLHDIGLIGLPDPLLGKPVARYNADEFAQYQRHAEHGEHALMPLLDMPPVAALIRAHHERFDGKGFPDGNAGAAIPMGARILAVVDAFDELQHGHLVESAMSPQEARTMIRHGRGHQFDPEVVDVFLHITEPEFGRSRAEVCLKSGQLEPGMVLARDLLSPTGALMLSAGHVLGAALIERIQAFDLKVDGQLLIHVKPRGAP
ncbi:HD domain-containing phosphohydrolase [Hydrogenophaga sp. T2]|uniref:HD domain-containing phosphohydrolase n=1 Tax=Hydrogenophaga sp. T2 TaxID=3132823 RepID=UPI003CF0FC1C